MTSQKPYFYECLVVGSLVPGFCLGFPRMSLLGGPDKLGSVDQRPVVERCPSAEAWPAIRMRAVLTRRASARRRALPFAGGWVGVLLAGLSFAWVPQPSSEQSQPPRRRRCTVPAVARVAAARTVESSVDPRAGSSVDPPGARKLKMISAGHGDHLQWGIVMPGNSQDNYSMGYPPKSRGYRGIWIYAFVRLASRRNKRTLVHSFLQIVHCYLSVGVLRVESRLTVYSVMRSGVPAGDRMGHRLMGP